MDFKNSLSLFFLLVAIGLIITVFLLDMKNGASPCDFCGLEKPDVFLLVVYGDEGRKNYDICKQCFRKRLGTNYHE